MTPPIPSPVDRPARLNAGYAVLAVILVFLAACAIGVVGVFHLSSESTVLRQSVMGSVAGNWDKKIAIHVGWVVTTLVRGGSRFFNVPPEPRAALDAVHACDVGVYNLR